MKSFLTKFEKLKIGWNYRSLNEDDFFAACKRFKVKVTEMPLAAGGFYYAVKGVDYIAIDKRLSGREKIFACWHEFGHFLMHKPENGFTANFLHAGEKTRSEREADSFAAICMIPGYWLKIKTVQELLEEDGFSEEFVRLRMETFEEYGI
jgi:Zn-dependent peptidase ImmA (M78 family)